MKKISIIGSESFLAKNLYKYLNEYKEERFIIKRYDYKPFDETDDLYTQINFSDVDSIRKIDFDVDILLVFIGKTGTVNGFADYNAFVSVNEIYLLNILTAYVQEKSKARIIYPSSRLLFKSDGEKLINEESPRDIKSVYAVTKQASEEYLKVYNNSFGIDYVILRICTPFGSIIDSDGNYGTFEIFRNQARKDHAVTIFGDGTDKKTYTDIRDVCEAFYRLIIADKVVHKSYNLGGQILSMNEAVSFIISDLDASITHVQWPENYLAVDGGTVMFDSSRFDSEFKMNYRKIINMCDEGN